MKGIPAVLLLLLAAVSGAVTVTVAPGDAIRDSLATLGSGDTLYLSPGTYTIPDSIPLLHVGPDQDGVVITADSLDRPVLDGAGFPRPVIYLEGPLSEATLVENICLTGGNAVDGAWFAGGGLFMTFSDCIITNCTITGCTALFGGGVYAEGGSPVLEWLDVSGNTSLVTGGGLGFYASTPLVRHTVVSDNSSGDDGGGVYMTLGDLTIENALITGNSSGDDGGGVMHLQGSRCDLSFVTIDSNFCADDGAGVLASSVDSLIVYSGIVTSNEGNGGLGVKMGSEAWLISHCCVWDNGSTNYLNMPDQTGIMGNISEDPLFADSLHRLSQTASGQTVQSPAVDAGHGLVSGMVIAGLSTRTDSIPDDGTADMGFHHGPPDTSSGPGGSEPFGFGIRIFPCPSRGQAVIRLSVTEPSLVDVSVWDACGRKLDSMTGLSVGETLNIPWNVPDGFPAGLLLFRMSSPDRHATGRLVYIP